MAVHLCPRAVHCVKYDVLCDVVYCVLGRCFVWCTVC